MIWLLNTSHALICIKSWKQIRINFFQMKFLFQTTHGHATRSTSLQLTNLPFYRLNKCQRSFLYLGISLWNKIPIDIRNIPGDIRKFKKSLRTYIIDRIWFFFVIEYKIWAILMGTFGGFTFIVVWWRCMCSLFSEY